MSSTVQETKVEKIKAAFARLLEAQGHTGGAGGPGAAMLRGALEQLTSVVKRAGEGEEPSGMADQIRSITALLSAASGVASHGYELREMNQEAFISYAKAEVAKALAGGLNAEQLDALRTSIEIAKAGFADGVAESIQFPVAVAEVAGEGSGAGDGGADDGVTAGDGDAGDDGDGDAAGDNDVGEGAGDGDGDAAGDNDASAAGDGDAGDAAAGDAAAAGDGDGEVTERAEWPADMNTESFMKGEPIQKADLPFGHDPWHKQPEGD